MTIVGTKNTPKNREKGEGVVGGNTECNYRFHYRKYFGSGDSAKMLFNAPQLQFGQAVTVAN